MSEGKRIVFFMPRDGSKPIGGFKIVYEYANMLANDGHHVSFVYPIYIPRLNRNPIIELLRLLKSSALFLKQKIRPYYSCRDWFQLNPNVSEKSVWRLESYNFQDDIIIATAATTAPAVSKRQTTEVKYYFIQHFEKWAGASAADIYSTYRLNINLITISNWLKKSIESIGEKAKLVPNGFNTDLFRILTPPEKRNPLRILTLYHEDKWKGTDDVINAVNICKTYFPNIELVMFGSTRPAHNITENIEFHYQCSGSSLVELYNSASIYFGASHKEGWGLTIGEAMLCGCAVVCTDNEGYLEMAVHNRNALISPVGDIMQLVDNILTILSNQDKRIEIAYNGHNDMQKFNFADSYQKFKVALGLPC